VRFLAVLRRRGAANPSSGFDHPGRNACPCYPSLAVVQRVLPVATGLVTTGTPDWAVAAPGTPVCRGAFRFLCPGAARQAEEWSLTRWSCSLSEQLASYRALRKPCKGKLASIGILCRAWELGNFWALLRRCRAGRTGPIG
jgi:hypothetical protein